MRITGRRLIAVVMAAGAVWLLVSSMMAAAAGIRSRRAIESSCDSIPAAAKNGTWVRLRGCGVNFIHDSFLTDVTGRRIRRLVPLWHIDAEARKAIRPSNYVRTVPLAPTPVVMAVGVRGQPDGFRVAPAGGLYPDGLTMLVETTGVIIGRVGTSAYRIEEVTGQESGVAEGAVIIDLRLPPDMRSAGWGSAIGLALLLFAGFLFTRDSSGEREGAGAAPAGALPGRSPLPPRRAPASPVNEVKWGRVFVFVLVGVVALWRGVTWYFDPLRELRAREAARVGAAAVVPSPSNPGPIATPAPTPEMPEATHEELALIGSTDQNNQLKGIELLNARAATPDMAHAVQLALSQKPSPAVEAKLICLQTRFDTPESLDRMIARFPRERRALDWTLPVDVACTLNALARRAGEAPERVRDALMPAVYATNYTTRSKVLATFKTTDLPQIPAALVTQASVDGPYRREALAAALALGAVRLHPEIVAAAAQSQDLSSLVRQELRTNADDGAARLIARIWVDGADREFERLAHDREAQSHDVSAALVEIVLDAAAADGRRQRAADRLRELSEVGALTPLQTLSATLDPGGALKQSVDAAVATLDDLRKNGRRPQMRALF